MHRLRGQSEHGAFCLGQDREHTGLMSHVPEQAGPKKGVRSHLTRLSLTEVWKPSSSRGVLTSAYPSMQIGQLTVPEGLEHRASCQCRANTNLMPHARDVLCARSLASKSLLWPCSHRRPATPGVSGATEKGEGKAQTTCN